MACFDDGVEVVNIIAMTRKRIVLGITIAAIIPGFIPDERDTVLGMKVTLDAEDVVGNDIVVEDAVSGLDEVDEEDIVVNPATDDNEVTVVTVGGMKGNGGLPDAVGDQKPDAPIHGGPAAVCLALGGACVTSGIRSSTVLGVIPTSGSLISVDVCLRTKFEYAQANVVGTSRQHCVPQNRVRLYDYGKSYIIKL
ncbi:hypothetical protein BDQ17DRAFT_1327326 [Cyathus striatus]|nr:hypothetical protein BDQ17DRAFT_1327326 [Cyathus striatus]